MITFFVNGRAYQVPYEVNEAITAIMQENERLKNEGDKLRAEVLKATWILHRLHADLETTLHSSNGFATV